MCTSAALRRQIFILMCVMNTITTMSWTSKEKQRNFEIANAANGVEVYFEDQEECYDDHEKCNEYEALCPKYKILRQRCKLTCGTCNRNPPAPPINCTRSRFGCCWDNKTEATGPNFRGCADCVDKYPECKYFRDKCADQRHSTIRTICPVTCGVGCEKKQCLDNPYQKDVCKLYKKYNFCKISPDLMSKMCANTCGFC